MMRMLMAGLAFGVGAMAQVVAQVVAQAANPGVGASPWSGVGEFGVQGGLAALILWLWRVDRQTQMKLYSELASNYRAIVEENTAALTKNAAAIDKLGDVLVSRPCIVDYRQEVKK